MPHPRDNARFIFLIILILWLNAGNDNGAGLLSAPSLILNRLQQQRAAYTAMTATHWGDFVPRRSTEAIPSDPSSTPSPSPSRGRYLNLTGFREEDGLAWDDLDTFRQRCLEWSRNAYPSLQGQSLWDLGQTMLTWQNATGSVHGPWVRRPGSVHRDAGSYNLSALIGSADWSGFGNGGGGSRDDNGASSGGQGASNSSNADGGNDPLAALEGDEPLEKRNDDDNGGGEATSGESNGDGGDGGDGVNEEGSDNDAIEARRRFNRRLVPEWGRNVTGQAGKILVRLSDQDEEELYDHDWLTLTGEPRTGGLVRAATATVTIEDIEGTGSSYDMSLHGVHWPRQGVLLLTTTSEKFAGIFGLPHLTPGVDFFQSSQRLLNRTLDAALRKRETARIFGPPDPTLSAPLWTSSVDGGLEGFHTTPRCEYIMYVQIHPVDASQFLPQKSRGIHREKSSVGARHGHPVDERGLPQNYDYSQDEMTQIMLGIEHELRFPTGAPIFSTKGVPDLKMSAVLYSPDCAYFLETKGPPHFAPVDGQHLHGMKAEVFLYEARLWMLAFAVVLGAQVRLLLGQVRETYTPSTLGRVSFYTVAAMLLADGLVFAAASAWTLTAAASFLPSLVVTFVGFLSITIGGSFLSEIYSAQEPERRRRERQEQQQQQQQQQQLRQQLRQYYATVRTESPPIIVPSDQDIDAEIAENATADATPLLPLPVTAATAGANTTGDTSNNSNNNATAATTAAAPAATTATTNNVRPSQPFSSIAGRMVMLGVVLLFLSLAASTWWAAVRTAYANIVAFLYLSMWVPQILRNIERNSRRALSWRFMIGQSVLRLLPLAYFYLRSENILFAQTDWRAFAGLAAWVWVQLWVLAFQDVLGPRFGIPSSWVPEAWEYHPVLREDNIEAGGMPIGLVSTVAPIAGDAAMRPSSPAAPKRRFSRSGGTGGNVGSGGAGDIERGGGAGDGGGTVANTNIWTMDCAICCETLDVPVVRAGVDDPTAGGVAGVLVRRQYMVTPCRHIFHTACLEGWLRFRLQCPICREELPPL